MKKNNRTGDARELLEGTVDSGVDAMAQQEFNNSSWYKTCNGIGKYVSFPTPTRPSNIIVDLTC